MSKLTGLVKDLSEGRRIEVLHGEHEDVEFFVVTTYINGERTSRAKLSTEAMETIVNLWAQLILGVPPGQSYALRVGLEEATEDNGEG